jgi:hypothetical protein
LLAVLLSSDNFLSSTFKTSFDLANIYEANLECGREDEKKTKSKKASERQGSQ